MRPITISYKLPGLVSYELLSRDNVTKAEAADLTRKLTGLEHTVVGFTSEDDGAGEITYRWYCERGSK